ncbi:hypothetical protein [Kitasatospora sp. NPDC001132]
MAFYLVTDGRTNEFGEADTFVVRASGVRQAVKLAPLSDPKWATAVKLEDGRDVKNGVVHASLVDFAPVPVEDSTIAPQASEPEDNESDSFYGTYSY